MNCQIVIRQRHTALTLSLQFMRQMDNAVMHPHGSRRDLQPRFRSRCRLLSCCCCCRCTDVTERCVTNQCSPAADERHKCHGASAQSVTITCSLCVAETLFWTTFIIVSRRWWIEQHVLFSRNPSPSTKCEIATVKSPNFGQRTAHAVMSSEKQIGAGGAGKGVFS